MRRLFAWLTKPASRTPRKRPQSRFLPTLEALEDRSVPDATTTGLLSAVSPSVFGQPVEFTATVSSASGTPTGTVEFREGATLLGSVGLTAGEARFTTTNLTVGPHTIAAAYLGFDIFDPSLSPLLGQIVGQAGTSTTLVSSINPSVFGQAVAFTVTVSAVPPGAGTPTGMVDFRDGAATLGTGMLDGSGQATFTTTSLPVGSRTISAVYQGDTNFLTSTSADLGQTVNQAVTVTTVQSSLNPSVFGQAVTFTATVSVTGLGAGTPTGVVTFRDGATTLGTGTLNASGQATFSATSLPVGSRSITAEYEGDSSFSGSTSSALNQTVNSNSSTALISSLNPALFGQSVTFTATVTAVPPSTGTPTGTVTFRDGTTTLGTGTVNATGQATFPTTTLAVGNRSITAVYEGDSTFSSSTSAALTQTVNPNSSTVVISSLNPAIFGQSVTFTATVTAVPPATGTPTGTVTFRDGTTTLGTGTVNATGQATFTTTTLEVGSRSITAVYEGDNTFSASTSPALTQTVNPNSTTVVISSLNPSVFGQSVTFTATVTAVPPATGTPTGTVTFRDGTTTLGTGTLNASGQATFTTTTLPAGSRSITAVYEGSSTFSTSTSPVLTQTVTANSAVALISSLNPSVFGQSVTFTATVTAVPPATGTPTGTVTFRDGTTTLGTGTLNASGQATFATTAVSAGSRSITAVYGGEGIFSSSTSPVLTQTVNQAATTTAVISSQNPSVFGQAVTFTATVNVTAPGAGTPGGTVTFRDGTTILGTGTLNSLRQATFVTTSLALGNRSITAVYAGDTNFAGSTSPALTQTVNQASTTTGLVSSSTTTVRGQAVTFSAFVNAVAPGAGIPTGTVTFRDGTTTLGTGTLNSFGQATFSTTSLAVGSRSITAIYAGDTNFATSTSTALTQTVNQAATTVVLVSSANPSAFGQSVTFTVIVSIVSPGAGTPTGTVTFRDGTATLGTGTLNASGQASFTTSALAVGSRSITAVYAGDTNFATSTSTALAQTVNQAATSTTVAATPNPALPGQAVTITATVRALAPGAGTPTGTVTFRDGTTTLGTATLSGGTATFTTSSLTVGSHSLTAVYAGDASFSTSTSAAVNQQVDKAAPALNIVSSFNPSFRRKPVTFTVRIGPVTSGAAPTGTVTFFDGGRALGTASVSGGQATFTTALLSRGVHSITAIYSGDTNVNSGNSAPLTQTVGKRGDQSLTKAERRFYRQERRLQRQLARR